MHSDVSLINPTYVVGGCIAVYEDIWPEYQNTIDQIVSLSSDVNSGVKFTLSQTYDDVASGNPLQQSVRTSSGLSVTDAAKNNELISLINKKANNLIILATKNYKEIFKIEDEIKHDDDYYLLRYSKGEKYQFHYDGNTRSKRAISVLIYLNSDYEGGEIEFSNFNIKIKPKSGTLILFPSNYAYGHIAHPVISGTKYVIVTWLGDR
jgi:hypothetical protein